MVGNLCHTLIAVFDVIFMSRYDKNGNTDLATIGFVTMFYLVLVLVGYNFSKGSQILIAKRTGEGDYPMVGRVSDHGFAILMGTAFVLMLILMFFFKPIFLFFVGNPKIAAEGALFMTYRAPGLLFNFFGLTLVSYFAGTNRTAILGISMATMAAMNIFLNWLLIFGKWGFPEMGIAGSGLASTLSEVISSAILLIGLLLDKRRKEFHPFRFVKMESALFREQILMGLPLVGQSLIGFISWIVFFSFISRMGEDKLAVSNVVKSIYQLISIPSWSLANAVNTIIGNITGQKRIHDISAVVRKVIKVSFLTSLVICSFVFIFPEGCIMLVTGKAQLVAETREPLLMVTAAMLLFAISVIILNVIVSLGSTMISLTIEVIAIAVYLAYTFFIFNLPNSSLTLAWTTEIVYWVVIGAASLYYLKKFDWKAKFFED